MNTYYLITRHEDRFSDGSMIAYQDGADPEDAIKRFEDRLGCAQPVFAVFSHEPMASKVWNATHREVLLIRNSSGKMAPMAPVPEIHFK